MMKYPHCGSTAQVRAACAPFVSGIDSLLKEGFDCGCGAHFSVEYQRNEEGIWEHYSTFVDFVRGK